MKVFITRHGQTEWNSLGRLQGRKDIELNEVGKEQALITGEKIKDEKIDIIITSPLKRARETAEIINKQFNVEIVEDDRLMERCYGDFEGITKVELKEKKIQYPEIDDACNYLKNINKPNPVIFVKESISDLIHSIEIKIGDNDFEKIRNNVWRSNYSIKQGISNHKFKATPIKAEQRVLIIRVFLFSF